MGQPPSAVSAGTWTAEGGCPTWSPSAPMVWKRAGEATQGMKLQPASILIIAPIGIEPAGESDAVDVEGGQDLANLTSGERPGQLIAVCLDDY